MSNWIWGRHPVLEALRAGSVESVLLARGRHPAPVLDRIVDAARTSGIPLREVDGDELLRVAPGANTQGVAARVAEPEILSLDRLLGDQPVAPLLLVLDQMQDPHNVGALLRSSSAAGATGVVLTGRRSASLTGTVAKTSAGAIHHVAIAEVTNLARSLDAIREAGIWITGLEGSADMLLYDVDLTAPSAIVVGGEGAGLRRLTRERCDFLARLPMVGPIDSLNASVAGSIAVYEAVRQRLPSGAPISGVG